MSDLFGVRGGVRGLARAFRGVIFWRRYTPASQTYCLRSIITIASAVRNNITANVSVTPANMLISSSSIGSFG